MQHYNWSQVAEEQLNPMMIRQMIHGSTMTIARLRIRKGGIVPEHSHLNEQIATVEQGALRFITPEGETLLRAGESLCLPPHLPHGVEALEDTVEVDIFSPVREDWIRGDDAYLRK